MELRDWHVRLGEHFKQLRQDRSRIAPDHPIFGLEHDLDLDQRKDLSGAIRAHILQRTPSRDQRLAWIVYATEIGYIFAGDEYWQTFEEQTPGWTIHGDRYWLRECFLWFQAQFGGAKPSGRWAEHFSIICWPITHAVLPQDLQQQLARILYELRHSFSAELFESPTKLGKFIEARSWNYTSRFQNLAEETLLVGQIATALLLQDECDTAGLLHSETLKRIGEDLDSKRRARDWLRSARRLAKERAQIRGLSLGLGKSSAIDRSPEHARVQVAALGIEPRLILRPTGALDGSWDVSLEIPDLSHLLLRFPHLRDILTGYRCVVAGSSCRPLARGRCLHGAQRVALSRWPSSDEVLLQFEQSAPELEYLLRAECLLRPGPTWLFRIASDGLAYECRGLRVRPGERYIIVNTAGPVELNGHARPVGLTCDGVHGAIIELPEALTEDWEEALRGFGLSQARTIDVWPAGLAAAVWDGEGHGEWLASESPCLAIRSDHPIDALLVSMGSGVAPSLELTPIIPGEAVFVELPQLPVGLHTVHVRTRQHALGGSEPLGDLDVMMRIREARPWPSGVSAIGPLVAQIYPASPSLEQLWEGRVTVELNGPCGRPVTCKVSFFERNVEGATVSRELPPIPLPVKQADWRDHFEKHIRKRPEVQNAYDAASACKLEFRAEELGAFSIRCERAFTPIRWAVRRDGQRYVVRIIDDSGSSEPLVVGRYAFEAPTKEERVEDSLTYQVPRDGGLYVGHRGDLQASIIVPPEVRAHAFADLQCVPRIDESDCSPEAIIRLLRVAKLWARARLSGTLIASSRQRVVLLAITQHIFRLLGGANWEKAELSVHDGDNGLLSLKRAVSSRREESGLAAVLTRECASLVNLGCLDRVGRLSSLAGKFLSLQPGRSVTIALGSSVIRRRTERSPDDSNWLCELALRLASDPANVEAWAGDSLLSGLKRLSEIPSLARAARFFVIAVHRHVSYFGVSGVSLYEGWKWT